MPSPIILHFWPTPNGLKITIALEEMGLPYEVRPVNIGAGEQFRPEFLAISPNNRMPAIEDPEAGVSVFESGAILQYLGRKSGLFYPSDERGRVEVEQWLFWQVGGLGPMAGQTHHFRNYAPAMEPDPAKLEYGVKRYTGETTRLYGVMERRLADRAYLAGEYSIADMAAWPWILPEPQGQTLEAFPHLRDWHERVGARPAVQRGKSVGAELRSPALGTREAEEARKVLFGQKSGN